MDGDFINVAKSSDVELTIHPEGFKYEEIVLNSNKPFVQVIESTLSTPIFLITGLKGNENQLDAITNALENFGPNCIFVEHAVPRNFNIKQINTKIQKGMKGLILVKAYPKDQTMVQELTGTLKTVYDNAHYVYITYISDNISKTGYSIIFEPTF